MIANFYTNGHSEKILGDWFAAHPGRRQHVVLASKFFGNMFPGDPNGGGAGRASIVAQLDETLRRLGTDCLDLYWLHNWDRHTPIDETLRTLDGLVRAGKIRNLGFSNTPAWVTAQAQTTAALKGWTPYVGGGITGLAAFPARRRLADRRRQTRRTPREQPRGLRAHAHPRTRGQTR